MSARLSSLDMTIAEIKINMQKKSMTSDLLVFVDTGSKRHREELVVDGCVHRVSCFDHFGHSSLPFSYGRSMLVSFDRDCDLCQTT